MNQCKQQKQQPNNLKAQYYKVHDTRRHKSQLKTTLIDSENQKINNSKPQKQKNRLPRQNKRSSTLNNNNNSHNMKQHIATSMALSSGKGFLQDIFYHQEKYMLGSQLVVHILPVCRSAGCPLFFLQYLRRIKKRHLPPVFLKTNAHY